ncbi:serine hydrolase domain-containing protein [Microbacterium azadirachtae]|uniref:serine hydrolase domain-containing protein n=1 Tax=Microbacterium azadirachtae TaxID=582680 RepID=UPI00088D8234|nr:serine hydrolase domain-containing protein [Microbacterium azadirachtae]SDM03577.1 CubicO group peptidase, beta-lactamase class C family [Microbacterium azadirachtae]SEG29123.1 CubicO group peptidase, beta-lactamase class C family [Microbacterium azadirachtae]SEG32043.1 CubicO group peptidase, beta-lactamase class C family [Microbacterium azadirachtae]
MTSQVQEIIERHVAQGTAPGIVVADGDASGRLDVVSAGDFGDDAIVRIQSMTKPVLAVATLRLVQDGRLDLDAPVERWMPELADRRVLRTPDSALDDVVPATSPITVRHLLTNTSGYGMTTTPGPLRDAMVANRTQASQEAVALGAQDWLDALAALPLMFSPGEGWRYHHSFGVLGILLGRVVGRSLEEHLAEDLFEPLGMVDTGYTVPRPQAHRLPAAFRHGDDGPLIPIEPAGDGFYMAPAPFDLSHAELVSTASDYAAFARMLAAGGRFGDRLVVEPRLLDEMRTDRIPPRLKTPDSFFPGFWDGMGWGYGVAVQTEGPHRGRYGWSGGLGTDVYIDPDGSFRVILTQIEMGPQAMRLFTDLA